MEIQFLGATQEVTGSCFLLEAFSHRFLIDCGLYQGDAKDEARNRAPFSFSPKEIDAVFLTHAHLDHSGRLPVLVKNGFRGEIYTHQATRDLCEIMLKDSAYLNEKDVLYENRKRHRKGLAALSPLYTIKEAEQTLKHFKCIRYDEHYEIIPGVHVTYRDAGHILGSAILEIHLDDGHHRSTVVFSGDLGHRGTPILRDPTPIPSADLVIMESTYGDRNHRSWEETWAELGDVIRNAKQHQGNILIPAFAVGRTQELLYTFKQNYDAWGLDQWQIFLDSPMAIEATQTYATHTRLYDAEALAADSPHDRIFDLPNLTLSQSSEQSMLINTIRSGAIIIAGSGMCDGGRIRHHLKHNIGYKGNHVIIVGFQARNTLGRSLVDGTKAIRLWGESYPVKATIHTIGGLSAHADQDGLVEWVNAIGSDPAIALIHGELRASEALAQRLKNERHGAVIIPTPGSRLKIPKIR